MPERPHDPEEHEHLSHSPSLELSMLRRSVRLLEQHRESCQDCGRTPLTGEKIHAYDDGLVCELCSLLRKEEPLRSSTVHSPMSGNSVRLRVRRAA